MDSIDQRALTVDQIKRLMLGTFEVPGGLTERCDKRDLYSSVDIEVLALCRVALDELVAEGRVEKLDQKSCSGSPFYRRVETA